MKWALKVLGLNVRGPLKSLNFIIQNHRYHPAKVLKPLFYAIWTGQCIVVYKMPKKLLMHHITCFCIVTVSTKFM